MRNFALTFAAVMLLLYLLAAVASGIDFHVAWNYSQSGIFSGIVSGNEAQQRLIRSTTNGPTWLTGGSFGGESSVLALLLCTTTGIVMLVIATKRGKIVPQAWIARNNHTPRSQE